MLLLGLLANLTVIGSDEPFGMVPFSSWIARSASTRWSNLMKPTPFDRPAERCRDKRRNTHKIASGYRGLANVRRMPPTRSLDPCTFLSGISYSTSGDSRKGRTAKAIWLGSINFEGFRSCRDRYIRAFLSRRCIYASLYDIIINEPLASSRPVNEPDNVSSYHSVALRL